MKQVVILGSTGSIGVNTLKVIEEHPDQFRVAGLAAGSNVEKLAQQVRAFRPRWVAIREEARVLALREGIPASVEVLAGEEGIAQLASKEEVDLVIVAITGAAALAPVLAAIAQGRAIGLANKETLVMAGELVMGEAARRGASILPIDSEHSAIFQCLRGHPRQEVRRILLTTSGGPLKDVPAQDFSRLPKDQVMAHPRWKMGPKITVDSATMMNKALEVIEARWLFGIEVDRIEVVVHPEAIVHSMVEFIDGSILAQLGVTDMRIPIQYAMTYPDRLACRLPALDLVKLKTLTFEAPQREKFPCLDFGYRAARAGGTAPAVLNAANEACVRAFLQDGLPFWQIPALIGSVVSGHRPIPHPTLEQILEADAWAHQQVQEALKVPGTYQAKGAWNLWGKKCQV